MSSCFVFVSGGRVQGRADDPHCIDLCEGRGLANRQAGQWVPDFVGVQYIAGALLR